MDPFSRTDRQPAGADQTDTQAIERYRYLLRTAPPDEIERAHEEAFGQLTPEQRRQALHSLAEHVPQSEIRGDDPASLARTATRAEMREPGTIERAWGGQAGMGFGLGSFFLSTLAASFIGTAIAQSFFDNDAGADSAESDAAASDSGDGDIASTDTGEFDSGGGDFGGGDFGGGDFGGF
jgi:hypothetical protein